jgi:RNA polymerase sigma-70 factor, ECF subfamily
VARPQGPQRVREPIAGIVVDVDPNGTEPRADAAARFRAVVTPELPVLLRVARRMTGDVRDAEDLVQETLLRAYRAIERFDGRHPRAWLLTIQRNTWRNMNRRRRPVIADTAEELERVVAHGAEGRTGPEERVLAGVLEAELAVGLRRLSTQQRAVIVLVDVDGLSYREAAEVLGVPTGTVMSRLHRGRAKLRKHLERAGIGPGGRRP